VTFLIKKKLSETSREVFKSTRDYNLRVLPFSSSKLFTKLSRQRRLNSAFQKKLVILKFLGTSPGLSRSRKSFVNLQLDNSLKNISGSKLISTSIVGYRCISFSKDFRLSRISLRELASFGFLPGIMKSSW